MCGSIAGGLAAALTTPLDVLKTRVMLDLRVRPIHPIYASDHDWALHSRIQTKRNYHQCQPALEKYIQKRAQRLFLQGSYHGRYGYRPGAPSSSGCTSGRYAIYRAALHKLHTLFRFISDWYHNSRVSHRTTETRGSGLGGGERVDGRSRLRAELQDHPRQLLHFPLLLDIR